MDTQKRLLLLQILYSQKPNWNFSELGRRYNEHPLVKSPLEDPPAVAIHKAMTPFVEDLPRRITVEYLQTEEGVLDLVNACEGLYALRIKEIESQVESNKEQFQKLIQNV